MGPETGTFRVIRGGSWGSGYYHYPSDGFYPFYIYTYFRQKGSEFNYSDNSLGFRCARGTNGTGDSTIISSITPELTTTIVSNLINCEYAIQSGNSIGEILNNFNITIDQLYKGDHKLIETDILYVGELLTIKGITAQACTAGGGFPQQ